MSDFPWIKRLGGHVFKAPSTARIRILVSWPAKFPVCVSGLSGNAVVRMGIPPSTGGTENPPLEVQVQFTDLQAKKKSPFHTHLVFQIPKPNQI